MSYIFIPPETKDPLRDSNFPKGHRHITVIIAAYPKHIQCLNRSQFFGHNFLVNRIFSILTFATERCNQKQSKSCKFDRFSCHERICRGKWKLKNQFVNICFHFQPQIFRGREKWSNLYDLNCFWFDLSVAKNRIEKFLLAPKLWPKNCD